jgi:hypothetical protein
MSSILNDPTGSYHDAEVEADAMLAQMCWLKWNEKQFLGIANVTKIREAA